MANEKKIDMTKHNKSEFCKLANDIGFDVLKKTIRIASNHIANIESKSNINYISIGYHVERKSNEVWIT